MNMFKSKTFKIKVKCVQTMELELPASAYCEGGNTDKVTPELIAKMEEDNVKSDPTYFDTTGAGSTIDVTVEVEEVKDA